MIRSNVAAARTGCLVLLIFMLVIPPAASGQNDSFRELQQKLRQGFDARQSDLDQQWAADMEAQKAAWSQLKAAVERKWQTFISSTPEEWVAYDAGHETRSRVDFENGRIEIEAVVPYDAADAVATAGRQIFDQARSVLNRSVRQGEAVLQNQVRDSDGRTVTGANVDAYLDRNILDRITPDAKPFKARDGRKRQRYSVTIDLVPEHLDVRIRMYLPEIKKQARRFNLDPRLVMAIIHTESFFNPLAVSPAGAIGLMQVIPRHAGLDAYRYLYDSEWIVRPEPDT